MVSEEDFMGWTKEVNSNPEIKKHGFKLVNLRTHYFYMTLAVMFLLILSVFVGVLFYLGMEGKLSSTYENIINPLFNASVNITNTYTFTPSTANAYSFNPNYTIVVNIPDNLCGGYNE